MSDRLGLVDLLAPLPHVQFVDMGLGQGVGPGETVGSGSGSGSVAVVVAMVVVEWLAQLCSVCSGWKRFRSSVFLAAKRQEREKVVANWCFALFCFMGSICVLFCVSFLRFVAFSVGGVSEVPRGLLPPLRLGLLRKRGICNKRALTCQSCDLYDVEELQRNLSRVMWYEFQAILLEEGN